MKLTALAVVILSLGIVVGFALAGGVSGPASAIPQCPGPSSQCATPTPTPPPERREDQITIFTITSASLAASGGAGFQNLSSGILFALDAADYPASAVYRLEAVMNLPPAFTGCVRLFSKTATAPIAESDACFTTGSADERVRVRSFPFSLPSGEHEYTLQATSGSANAVFAARIIVEWTE